MDVEAEITLRQPVQQLGLAPFSSMFWFGELTRPHPYDFRPEIHDSDGLALELVNGEHHFRPLDHTEGKWRHCVFALENPKSWALLQRDRAFHSYQDTEALYHNRPSVRVEPVSGFEKGNFTSSRCPPRDETNDNVVLVWEPALARKSANPIHSIIVFVGFGIPLPAGSSKCAPPASGIPCSRRTNCSSVWNSQSPNAGKENRRTNLGRYQRLETKGHL